jgi:ribosomal protein S18 acetylase RimI-like enzyme
MITYSNDKYLPALRKLWKLCFSDSDEFAALYFSKVYKGGETLIFLERDIVIASLQMIPYQLKIGNDVVKTSYISGAMTHPQYRNQKYMERLLLHAFDIMRMNSVVLTFLIPQDKNLIEYYAQYGFEQAFPRYAKEVAVFKDLIPAMKAYPLPCGMDLTYLYRSLLSKKTNVFLKTERQVQLIFDDVIINQGFIYVCASGIAIGYYQDNQVIVKELLVENESARHALLVSISEKYQVDTVTIYDYTPNKNAQLAGMVKLIDESFVLPKDIYMSMMLD